MSLLRSIASWDFSVSRLIGLSLSLSLSVDEIKTLHNDNSAGSERRPVGVMSMTLVMLAMTVSQ